MRAAGLPTDVFRSIVVAEADVNDITAALIDDERVAAVSLTGSERAGAAVAASAGRAVKKSLLELGGSDPFVVLDDADLDIAVASAVTARFINSGQSCLAAKPFIVQRAVADATGYGLAASVWSVDPDRALALGRRITSGACSSTRSSPPTPACRLAAPSTAATGGNSVSSARPSSPTSAPM